MPSPTFGDTRSDGMCKHMFKSKCTRMYVYMYLFSRIYPLPLFLYPFFCSHKRPRRPDFLALRFPSNGQQTNKATAPSGMFPHHPPLTLTHLWGYRQNCRAIKKNINIWTTIIRWLSFIFSWKFGTSLTCMFGNLATLFEPQLSVLWPYLGANTIAETQLCLNYAVHIYTSTEVHLIHRASPTGTSQLASS